jgi:hypothetical protein
MLRRERSRHSPCPNPVPLSPKCQVASRESTGSCRRTGGPVQQSTVSRHSDALGSLGPILCRPSPHGQRRETEAMNDTLRLSPPLFISSSAVTTPPPPCPLLRDHLPHSLHSHTTTVTISCHSYTSTASAVPALARIFCTDTDTEVGAVTRRLLFAHHPTPHTLLFACLFWVRSLRSLRHSPRWPRCPATGV